MFFLSTSASNGIFIADGGSNGGRGGTIFLADNSSAGASRVQLFDRGTLDVSNHDGIIPPATAGSLEGDGMVLLGSHSLTVGTNNLDTTFNGTIEDGGSGGGVGGSLIKDGTGMLFLTKSSGYTGGTTVNNGTLLLKGLQSTGKGDIQVKVGTLSGAGIISGGVTIGTGRQSGVFLAPGLPGSPARNLTIRKSLTFEADATLSWNFDSNVPAAHQLSAAGVTINGASFSSTDLGNASITEGTVIRVIANKAATPITGNFSNLPDGGTITVGSNTFQANYEGGDGNDLTLTVVP
jgi:autotransporter-associated beta strand protein